MKNLLHLLGAFLLVTPAFAVGRPWLGLKVCGNGSVTVQEVYVGSPAEKAGIQKGDRILMLEEEQNLPDMRDDLDKLRAGDVALVQVKRAGIEITLSVMVEDYVGKLAAKGSTVYLPLSTVVQVSPKDPLAPFECTRDCRVAVEACEPITVEAHGLNRLVGHWKGHRVSFDADLRDSTYSERESCLEQAKSHCGFVL